MRKILFILLLALTSPQVFSHEENSTVQNEKSKDYIEKAVPEGDEDIYNNFVTKYTKKDVKERFKSLNLPFPDMEFELLYAKRGTYPVILSNNLYEPTFALESRYQTYKQYHGKTNEANDKMYEERFYTKQNDVKNVYESLQQNNSNKEYLILIGVLSTDTGETTKKEKKIILLNPKYPDREWLEVTIEPELQKRVALTLVSSDGKAMEFLNSNRDFDELSERYEDPLIKFILESLYNNGAAVNPFFAMFIEKL